ncbi:TPA: hypothetical protein L4593_001863 [Pseudomonas aeruginosa]|nr:hypothetical protein [Pseudomonas aeruginosa]
MNDQTELVRLLDPFLAAYTAVNNNVVPLLRFVHFLAAYTAVNRSTSPKR